MPSQPYALACEGGLDKSSSSFELLRRPGAATRLRNFEVDIAGGYRRINGYSILGGDSDFIRFGFGNDASKIRFKHGGTTTNFTFDINPSTGKNLYTITRNEGDEMKISQNSTTALLSLTACDSGDFAAKRGPFGSKGIDDGSVYELVIYNRSVTAAETALIEADILTRNSLTAD